MACVSSRIFQCLSRNNFALRATKRLAIRPEGTFNIFLSTPARFSSKCGHDVSGRRYSDKHEWVSVKDGIGTVGISHYAQESLGEIVYVELPVVGETFEASAEVGTLESVKAASEVYAPVSGEITERNEEVEGTPSLINSSCYDQGWLYKVKLVDPNQLNKLMNEEAYQAYLKTQAHD